MNPCKHKDALQEQQQQRNRYMQLGSKRIKKDLQNTAQLQTDH